MDILTTNIAENIAGYGNRCGHVPHAPMIYTRPTENRKTYSSIHTAQRNLSEYYFKPLTSWLPHLFLARRSTRQQRSERREAIASIASVMANYVDLASMKIVRLYNKELIPLSVKELASKAGVHIRRAERAIKDLRESGYLELEYRYERNDEGDIVPKVAIKRLSTLFFFHLGVTYEKLKREIDRAKKHAAKFNKKARMKLAQLNESSNTLLNHMLPSSPATGKRKSYRQKEADRVLEKQRVQLIWQLKQQHPDLPIEQIKKKAESLMA